MKRLQSVPIVDACHVEVMRLIYNDNLDSLATKPLPYRTYEEQQQWWEANKHSLRAFLYETTAKPGLFIGFLVLRNRGGFETPTIALRKEDWGQGYGKEMVFDYLEKANGPLAGSQLRSNFAICHLNKKAGWRILGEREESNGMVELLFHPGVKHTQEVDPAIFASILDYLEMGPNDIFEISQQPTQ